MFEIGNTLREARMRRGLDIAECESATKIRAKYLRAMEEEHFDLLPSPAYVRGFLRTYADFLDMDGQLVVDEYESRFGGLDHPDLDHRRKHAPRRAARQAGGRAAPRRSRRRTEAQLLWAAIGGVMGIALVVWLGLGEDTAPAPPLNAGAALTTTAPAEQDPATATPEAPEAVRIRIAGVGQFGSYVEIRGGGPNGREVYRGNIASGDSRALEVSRAVWLRTGNAEGLEVRVNGKAYPLTGGTADFLITRQGPRTLGG
jgi:hypothetical protein